jgi:hypothetical protein
LTDSITSNADISVHGVSGQPRPQIFSSASFPLALYGTGSELRHIEVDGSADTGAPSLDFRGVVAEDFVARARGIQAFGCRGLGTATLRDGVCWATGDAGPAVDESGVVQAGINPRLRNITAIATGAGSDGISVESTTGRPVAMATYNTIARGARYDVAAYSFNADAILTTSHDNYRTAHQEVVSGPGTAMAVDDGTSQRTSDPLFANAATGDFHQLSGSPTIDGGADHPGNGTVDFDGDGRGLGAAPDIGADEFVSPPAATPAAVEPATAAPPASTRAVDLPPVLSALSLARRAFTPGRAPHGTRIRFTLSEAASVRVRISRRAGGRGHRRRAEGSIVLSGSAGRNARFFSGRIAGTALRPGRHRATLVATDPHGGRSAARSVSFTVRQGRR